MKNSYDESYKYKDEILKKYQKYNPIVHTNKEKDYMFLKDNNVSIEIRNNDKSLFIDLEDEITLYYDGWHEHFYYEDRNDYEEVIATIDALIDNKFCSIQMFSNDQWYATGSSNDKINFTKEEAQKYIKDFFHNNGRKEFLKIFKKQGVTIRFVFWSKDKNYEYEFNEF